MPHAWPAGLLPERKQAIRQCLEKHGLAIANVNAFMMNAVADPRQPYWHPSWIEPDPHYRAIRREHTKRALALAKELGAPSIQTEPGGPLPPGQTWQAAAKIFYDELMPCVELAQRLEVLLLIEPEPGLLVERFEQYLEVAGRVDSPWLGLNFDIGHAYCVGEDPQDWIARMAPHTKHYHVEDIAATRRHEHLVPGRGAIDFAAVLREIARSGYQGWITVELYPYVDDPDAAGREAKEFLERTVAMNEDNERGGALWAWLELLRLPNLFTAMADVAMGFLFVQVAAEGERTWQIAARRRRDPGRCWRPPRCCSTRPAWCSTTWPTWKWIARSGPSGRSPRAACPWLRHAGRAGCCWPPARRIPWIAAFQAGQVRPGLVGTLLAAAIVLYDLGLKRTPLGPLAMGGCRMLNVLLGMSVAGRPFHGEHFLVAGGIGLYIVGVTWLARNEAARGDRRQIFAATLVMMAGIGLLACLPVVLGWLPGSNTELVDLLRIESERGVGIW